MLKSANKKISKLESLFTSQKLGIFLFGILMGIFMAAFPFIISGTNPNYFAGQILFSSGSTSAASNSLSQLIDTRINHITTMPLSAYNQRLAQDLGSAINYHLSTNSTWTAGEVLNDLQSKLGSSATWSIGGSLNQLYLSLDIPDAFDASATWTAGGMLGQINQRLQEIQSFMVYNIPSNIVINKLPGNTILSNGSMQAISLEITNSSNEIVTLTELDLEINSTAVQLGTSSLNTTPISRGIPGNLLKFQLNLSLNPSETITLNANIDVSGVGSGSILWTTLPVNGLKA